MEFELTNDVRAVIESAHLCFAATVTPDGKPNLSPKGTIRVFDERRLFFLDIASPTTRSNLERSPWIELNIVEHLSRRGYRFFGQGTLHRGDAIYLEATGRVFREDGVTYPVEAVVVVTVERASALVSPGYWHVTDETEIRAGWKARRQQLDAAFEEHIRLRGPWRRDG